jgi:hypothetical protein
MVGHKAMQGPWCTNTCSVELNQSWRQWRKASFRMFGSPSISFDLTYSMITEALFRVGIIQKSHEARFAEYLRG